ncbi:MAG: AI-2E family transporter [Patescibacteria group bacterium]|mgnify:FL=1
MPKKVEISHRTIIFTAMFVLFLWFIFQIRDVLLIVFVSLILMSALNPAVDQLEKWRVPRPLAILLTYLVLWGTIGGLIAGIVPSLVDQTRRLITRLPHAMSQIEILNSNQQAITSQLLTQIGTLPENLLRLTVGIFGNLLTVFTTLVITFYLLLERKHLDKYLSALLGKDTPTQIGHVINEIERRLGGWIRGELFLMFVVGLFTYVGLVILGVDIALPLAIIAGVLEIVPNIGPTISAVPAVLIALTIHPLTALATVALYFLVQIIENNFLVPKVMEKAVGVNPLISILGLLIGLKIAGPAGAVLAIPLIIVIQTIGLEAFSFKRLSDLSE